MLTLFNSIGQLDYMISVFDKLFVFTVIRVSEYIETGSRLSWRNP